MDQQFLYRLEDELTRARYEIDENYRMKGIRDLRKALGFWSEQIPISIENQGETSVYLIGDREIEAPSVRPIEEVAAVYLRDMNPFEEMLTMSITDAGKLAGTIKDRINAAKVRIAQVSANTDGALAKLNDAADTGDKIAKQIEKEADDLLAEIGQFSNGGPV